MKKEGVKYPVILKLLVPLICGVILGFYTYLTIGIGVLLALVLGLLIFTIPKISKHSVSNLFFSTGSFILFLFLGLYLSNINDSSRNDNYFAAKEGRNNYLARIIESPQEKARSIKCVLEILTVNDSCKVGKTLVYLQKDSAASELQYGDLLYFSTSFNEIRSNGNPKEFDYARYLQIHNIHHQAYISSDNWKMVGHQGNPFLSFVFNLRIKLASILNASGMSSKNAMVANALLLGQKEFLDKDVLRSYSSAGAMHVLAVSGLHVGIVMLILTTLLSPLKRFKYGKQLFLMSVLTGIWFYALITGLSPSVMRAGVMFTFIVIGKELQRDTTIYQSILVSAFLLILYEPYIIFQVGFQLSYLAVLGIVYLQPKVENLIYVENKLLHKAWQISAVSIAAQIATFPLGLYYFHQFPNFFLLSNLLVIPLAFFILLIGISYLVFHAVPILSEILYWVLDGMISVLNYGVEWVEKLPYSIMWGISIEWYEVFLLYLTILLGSIAFINRKVKALFASISLSIFLLVINLEEKLRLENQHVLCVYNVNDDVAIDLFDGRRNTFIGSKELLAEEEKLLFHVKHNWFYRTGNEQPDRWLEIKEQSVINWQDQTLAIFDSSSFNNDLPLTSIVLLNNVSFIPNEVIEAWEQYNTTVLFGNKVKWSVKNYVKSNFSDLTIHDLKEDGAFELYE